MAKLSDGATKNKFEKFLKEKAVQNKGRLRTELMKELEKLQTRNELLENVNKRLFYVISRMGEEYDLRELEAYRNIDNVITTCSEKCSCFTDSSSTSNVCVARSVHKKHAIVSKRS